MPGVTVLSPSLALPGLGLPLPTKFAPMQNGASTRRESVAEIKAAAKEQAQKVRGASAISLLKSARSQSQLAHVLEGEGDLKGALTALTKAAALAQIFMESTEFKQEMQPGKKGVLVKDFLDFQKHEGYPLTGRTQAVEAKLLEGERSSSKVDRAEGDSEPVQRSGGGSIADRMRALQTAGLSVSSTKRLSREIPPTAAPLSPSPLSPDMARPNRASVQSLSSQLASLPSLTTSSLSPTVAASTSATSAASPHAFVPTSSLGPPSPTSSTSSSPRLSHYSLSEFTTQFPSIDELDEMEGPKLPSLPTGTSAISRASSKQSNPDLRGARPSFIHTKAFPVLPMDPGPRPSSTPIPPTIDTFISRPTSPSRSPRSPPSVPRKPSGLSLSGRSPVMAPTTPPAVERAETPISALFPKTLLECNNRSNYKVLVLDVRTRVEFEQEHLKLDAVVCIEPSVLRRDGINARAIEDSLTVAPRSEWALFSNRDKFDLVAIYDDESETYGPASSPLSILVREIYEVAFSKFLKQPPMLLVGGLQAWKREFGDRELVRGASGSSLEVRSTASMAIPNGLPSPIANAVASPIPSRPEPLPPTFGHTRLPAESTSAIVSPSHSANDLESSASGRHRPGTEPSPLHDRHPHRPCIPSLPNGRPTDQDATPPSPSTGRLVRKPAMTRLSSASISFPYTPSIPENTTTSTISPYTSPLLNGSSPIQYPQFARHISPQISGSSFSSSTGLNGLVSMPPQASINPSPLSRRRSDYVDQSQEALSGLAKRPSIDYPDLSSHSILRPPPAAAAPGLERQDNRPRLLQQSAPYTGPRPPTIQSDYPVAYWADIQIGTSGLKNLGNTCYMNSTIQCLSATVPFARFFTGGWWKGAVNMLNPLGTKGQLARAFASILHDMWQGEMQALSPVTFRRSICMYASHFGGTEQHDSQEFLSFLLDGLHEDLNRVLKRPQNGSTPEREAELENMPTQVASEQEWQIYRMHNDSLVVDFFQGQFRNRMECLTCHKTSTTYNAFMYLTLPIPSLRSSSKVSLHQCLEAFVKEEVMEKSDAWHCPHCKGLRKATKRLSLSRLPPVLLIHLKRFSVKGPFTDKIETFVNFPLNGLDLTNYMPAPLPPGVSGGSHVPRDDPRSQLPPYRYDLYGVTNHFGTLSSGHYTAFVASRGGWLYCDDSRISQADAKDVVGKPAYILFYKRVKA